MSAGTGSIDLTARRSGTRTVLERVRYDGISRCSRAFARDDAALIVLSQLGPGVVRGDRVTLKGQLRAGSRVIVTGQSATRLMGGVLPSASVARWKVEDGALLDVIGEPLIAAADAVYEASTTIELGNDACVLVSDIVRVPAGAKIVLRTSVRQADREVFYDAINAATVAPDTVGTFTLIGCTADDVAALVGTLDTIADARSDISVGVGQLPHGVFVRVLARDVWTARTALAEMRAAAHALQTRRDPSR